jgi:S-formylglutathione hydrolase
METVSTNLSFGGTQGVYTHQSTSTGTAMTFAVFVPPQAATEKCPVVWYLSGLTCSHANVMDKGEYRRKAAELGLIIVCPDTSPRGDDVANDDNWQLGQGAGFYVDATEAPWSKHFQMYTYVTKELPALIAENFPADMARQGITGHSMGGHGALTIALKNPETFQSCSAFAPITNPSTADWSKGAFAAYLGSDETAWADHDAVRLIESGARVPALFVDQGAADTFFEGCNPHALQNACAETDIALTLRFQEGYDHSYFFISTFMDDHLAWHADRLSA